MSARFWLAPSSSAPEYSHCPWPSHQPPARPRGCPGSGARPGSGSDDASTIRSIWPSRCTTPTSRWCATCASCAWRAASPSSGSWTSPRPSIPRPSTSARSPSRPQLDVLEQNYEYDLLEPDKLLAQVRRPRRDARAHAAAGRHDDAEEVTARLLSYNTAPVWQIGSEIVTGLHADHIRFPELPGNLYARPTLIWTLQNGGAERHRVEAAYLAGKLSWAADYVLNVGRDDKAADLDGWVTLTNGSGTAFRNARLQLVAGDLNRVRQAIGQSDDGTGARAPIWQPRRRWNRKRSPSTTSTPSAAGRRSTTPRPSRSACSAAPASPSASATSSKDRTSTTGTPIIPGAPIKDVVQVYYQFKNEEKAGLGMPMPAGTVRVYQADSKGGVQFVGEDRISHTPNS